MAENEAKEFNSRKWIIWTIIISVIIVVGTAIFLIVTYSNDDSGRSLIEYIEQGIVILLAVAGGCSSIISMINGKKNNEEQKKREDALRKEQCEREDRLLQQQKDFEEKWNQKKIDADLKARARIEWIQDVRKATSRFITACYCVVKWTDNYFSKYGENYKEEEIQQMFPDIQETGLLLILYFGPDKSGNNQIIVNKIDDLLEKIERISIGDYGKSLFNKIRDIQEAMRDGNMEKLYYCQARRRELLNEFESFVNEITGELHLLNGMIRTYLKTEWDRAKNNED